MKTADTYILDTSFSSVTDHVTRNTSNAGESNKQEDVRLFYEILKEKGINHDNFIGDAFADVQDEYLLRVDLKLYVV